MFRTLTTADPTASRRCSTSWKRPREACSRTCASVVARHEYPNTGPTERAAPGALLFRTPVAAALFRGRRRPHDVGFVGVRLRRRLEMRNRRRLVPRCRLTRLGVKFTHRGLL